ncbi:MAG: hypothetical protein LBL46_03860 [Rickettsiales bacterium]|nr:hypothetical protein [Rickettsiales bacterium]
MKKILSLIVALFAAAGADGADRYGAETARVGATGRMPTGLFPSAPAPSQPSVPGAPSQPTTPTQPVAPAPETPAAPSYGVENCMTDLSTCVENNLPNGIAALYNTDMRNSVVNGMNLCGPVVDKCVYDTRRLDGNKAYYAKNDVWIDFNSRVIQPQYYSHVLFKTGLTPNQAENTCRLLDVNAYGASFAAVNKSGAVTTEYNQNVNAYNNQGGGKNNPMGQLVNTKGDVDAQRGHYARWDATAGECLVRVAAYNKDELITNEWFGGIGDKKPAEQWKATGNGFKCAKETFDFNLMNNTKTAALASGIGVVGAAGVGAGIGAIAGHQAGQNEDNEGAYASASIKFTGGTTGTAAGTAACTENNITMSISVDLTPAELIAYIVPAINNNAECQKIVSASKSGDDTLVLTAKKTGPAGNKISYNYTNTASNPKLSTITPSGNLADGEKGGNWSAGKGALVGAGIGAAVGVGVGGIATAITAFVEHNNINCRIGDNLETIGFGKNGRIKSLKEYYVEWALRLPDTVMPQQTATECNSWNTACGSINNIADCAQAVITYKPADSQISKQIETACVISGSTCVANNPVAVSNGACQ